MKVDKCPRCLQIVPKMIGCVKCGYGVQPEFQCEPLSPKRKAEWDAILLEEELKRIRGDSI